MAIESVCKTNVVTVEKNANIYSAVDLMRSHHVGSLIVTESYNGHRIPAGIITDRDIALSAKDSTNMKNFKVENIMMSHPITVNKSEGIFETTVKMGKNGVKRMPVVNDDGSLFGIICADDLLNIFAEEMKNLSSLTDTQIKKEKGVRMPTEKRVQL